MIIGQENKAAMVSVHGGHSGQFCLHAENTLEEIVLEYIKQGFPWVGITEHTPGITDELLYPDEKEAGLTAKTHMEKFSAYIRHAKELKQKYKGTIDILVGMEIETYSGYVPFIKGIREKFSPDYIVGSVHFVNDIGFDFSEELYRNAEKQLGGMDNLYIAYFDQQYEMIKALKPEVVGHFDVVRIHDPEYRSRLKKPEIMDRIERNLQLIKKHDLIMDFNVRALLKNADEPYVSESILARARELEISVVPGDDSHGVSQVGCHVPEGINILEKYGFDTNWKKPGAK